MGREEIVLDNRIKVAVSSSAEVSFFTPCLSFTSRGQTTSGLLQRAAIQMFCTCKLALVRQDQNRSKTSVFTRGSGAEAFDLRPYGNLGKMKRSPGFQNVYLSYIYQVRVENVKDAACHIPVVLERVKREYIAKTYKVSSWTDSTDFLEQVARRTGKLLKVWMPELCP